MALTRAANEPNQVLQTPYFTLGSTLIPLGGSTSAISGNLTFNGNLTLNGPIVINSSTNGVALYVVKQDIWSNGFSVNKRGNFTDPNGAVVNSTELGYNGFYGWDGTTYGRGAFMFAVSEQNFSPGNHGARLTFHTTSVGSDDATERLRISSDGSIKFSGQVAETATISATSANTTVTYDVMTNKNILYYTSSAGANWTLNIRGNATNTIDSLMSVGQSLTLVFLNTNGATAYYQTGLQIDGVSVTPKWIGGAAPAAGNASAIDIYTITIIKTATSTYTVIEQLTKAA